MKATGLLRQGARIAGRLLKARATGGRIPIQAWLFVTNRCNGSCFYCFTRPYAKEFKDQSTQCMEEIIDELAGMGTVHFIVIGGEPMLRQDIGELIRFIRRRGGIVELRTNGFLIPEKIDEIRDVDSVCVSLDGDEAANDASRGKGSYAKAMRGITAAIEGGLNVHLHGVVTRYNVRNLEYLPRLARDLGVHMTYNNTVIQGGERDWYMSDEEIRRFYRDYRALKEKGYPILTNLSAIDYVIRWPYPYRRIFYRNEMEEVRRSGLHLCNIPRYTINVSADGYVYPCGPMFGKFGRNLREGGLRRAWEYIGECPCITCSDIGCVYNSMAFSFNPRRLLEAFGVALKNYVGGRCPAQSASPDSSRSDAPR
ncbi:MAG: radical SAM protein [bacterium]|nr:radical SAM protein [bacterium]